MFWMARAGDAVRTAIFWDRFKKWQKERNERLAREHEERERLLEQRLSDGLAQLEERKRKVRVNGVPPTSLLMIAGIAAFLSMGATCGQNLEDLKVYCCIEHPEECTNLPVKIQCDGVHTPTPTPSPTPAVPGRICGLNDCDCWHDPDDGCENCWIHIACPTPTPAATPTPTRRPTTATPTPAPTDNPDCVDMSRVPTFAVPVFTGQPCRAAQGYVPVGDGGCVRDWSCADGDQRYSPAARIGASLATGGVNGVHRCLEGEAPGPQFICDAGRNAQEAWGRPITANLAIIPAGPEDNGEPWRRAAICAPVCCEATPTPTPAGPRPTPTLSPTWPAPTQPDNFKNDWINICQELHYVRDNGDGTCSGECDGTYRFGGTLKSNAEYYRNTCDKDHWNCVVEDCTDRPGWPNDLPGHQKTYELCGGREWFTPDGVEFHMEGPGSFVRVPDRECPLCPGSYKHRITGPCGATFKVWGCMPRGARTEDGVLIPGGDGCGTPKNVKFEGR